MKKSTKIIISTVLLVAVLTASLCAMTACDEVDGYLPEENIKLALDINKTWLNDIPLGILFNSETSYIELTKDGTCNIHLMVGDLKALFENEMIAGVVSGLDLSSIKKSDLQLGYIDGYVNVLFPGFTLTDVEYSLGLIKKSIGVEIVGLDFTNEKLAALKAQIENPDLDPLFPASFSLADLPNGLGIVITAPYALLDVKGSEDGEATTMTAAMVGQHDAGTVSFATMTYYSSKSYSEIMWRNEMLGLTLVASGANQG